MSNDIILKYVKPNIQNYKVKPKYANHGLKKKNIAQKSILTKFSENLKDLNKQTKF